MPEVPQTEADLLETEVLLCQHSRTTDFRTISSVLLAQVSNLQKTDKDWRDDLGLTGGSLEQVRFVRGANYLQNLSAIVQRQEKEINELTIQVQRKLTSR